MPTILGPRPWRRARALLALRWDASRAPRAGHPEAMTYLRAFAALACVALLVPAVAADNDTHAPAAPRPAVPCSVHVAAAYQAVARNVYAQAVSGRAPAAARARLTRSPALVAAVARDDRRAARAALRPLLRGQIKRIV